MIKTGTTYQFRNLYKVHEKNMHAGWIKIFATIFFFTISLPSAMGQVIDFNNVSPNQIGGHTNTVTASGNDGDEVSITYQTPSDADPPTVSTATPTSIGTSSANLGGNVSSDGGATVTERGVVYGTSPDPGMGDNVVEMGSDTGSFSQAVTGLSSGTEYYVRAYATNSEGTNYGSEESFTTDVEVESIVRHDPSSSTTNEDEVVFQVELSGSVNDLSTSNFELSTSEVSGASVTDVSGSGDTYEVTVNTGSDDGTIRLDLDNSTGVSPTIGSLPFTDGETYTIDKTPPEINSITAQQSTPTNETDLEFVLVFSEDVDAPVAGDFEVTNASFQSAIGGENTFTLVVNPDDLSGEATITAEVLQGGVEDLAGNALSNSDSESVDYDGLAPEIADHTFFDSSSEEIDGITNDDSFTLEIEFNEDLDTDSFEAGSLTITNDNPDVSDNTLTGHSISGSTLTLDLEIPEAERDNIAEIDLEIEDGLVTDEAGNAWTGSENFEIVYNGTRPTVTLSTDDEITNAPVVPITITFSEEMDEFTYNDINVINGSVDSGSFNEVGTGVFEVNIIPQNTGAGQDYDITITIPDEAAEDLAGNLSQESNELVIDYDTTPFTVEFSSDEEDFTNESSFDVNITFNKPAPDFEIDDISESNATLSDFSANAEEEEFTVTVSPNSEGEITLNIDEEIIEDAAGNENEAADQFSIDFDETAPTPVISTTASANTNTSPIPVEIDFGEPVIDFTQSLAEDAISAANGSDFSIEDFETDAEDEVFTFNLVPDADDTFTIELAQGVVEDRAGNENQISNELVVAFNTSRPEITFRAVQEGGQITNDELDSPTNVDFFTLFIDFGEQMDSFDISDIDSDNANLDNFATANLSEGIYEVRVEPDGDGEITITIADGEVQDLAGNDNEEGEFQITSDRTAPTIDSIVRASGVNDPTNQSPFDIEITFSEEISDFDESGLSVTDGSASDFSTTDNITFTVEIMPDDVTDSSNTLEIGVPSGAFTDLAGNENEPDFENFTIEFGDTRPTAELSSSENDPTNADDFEVTLDVTEIFGQAVSSIDESDFTIEGAQITSIDDTSNPEFVLTVEPLEDGEITIQLNENVLTDAAGNQNEASNEFSIIYNTSRPEITFRAVEEGGSINSDELESPINNDFFTLFIDFGEQMQSFGLSDMGSSNASLDNFETVNLGDGIYEVRVEPVVDDEVSITIADGEVQDLAGNNNVEGEFLINSDRTAPTITSIERSSGLNDPTNESPFDVEITFSEEISNFDESELSVTNGDATDFSTTDNITFTVEITPDDVTDSSNTLEIGVPAGAFTDLAGNENEADTENFTIEFGDTRPTAELTSSENDPTNADDFEVTLNVTEIFGQPVSSIDSDDFTINRAEITSIDAASNPEFVLTVEPLEEGEITIQLNENVLTDAAGNQNEASNEFTITYDISPPTVAITSNEEDPTNSDDFEVTITFNKPVFNFDIDDINAGDAQLSDFTGNDGDTEYTVTVAPDGDGLVTVDVPEGVAQDNAGNDNEEADTFEITSDRTAPTISSIQRVDGLDDPTNQSPFDIEITFSEEISDFDESGLSVPNGSATGYSTDDDIEFTVTIDPDDVTDSSNTLEIGVPAGAFTDLAGNENEADTENFTIEFGDTRPTAELTSSENDPTNADAFQVTLDVTEIFGQPVSSIDSDDFTTTRAEITDIDDAGNPEFVLTVEPDEEGEVSIQLDENVLTDLAGNQNEASNEFTITYDISPPTVAITSDEEDPTNSDDFEVTITFNKPVFNFDIDDINAGDAQLSGFTGNDGDTEYTVTVAPDGDGLVTVDVPEDVAQDNAGNDNEEADTFEITSDRTAPTISSIQRVDGLDDPTNQSPFDIEITFSEEIDDFDESGLSVTDGSATSFSTTDNIEFTVTIEPDDVDDSSNTLEIGVPAGAFTDLAGNENEADSENFTIEFGDTRPTAELTSSENDPTNADDFEVTFDVTEIFGQAVSSIDESDFTIERAQITDIDATSNPEFVLTVEPLEDGDINIQLNENVLTDAAGNQNEESNEFSIIYDTSRPEITFRAVEVGGQISDDELESPTNADFFTLFIDFGEQLESFALSDMGSNNASLDDFETVNLAEGIYSVRVEPDGDGEVSITIADGEVQDLAGNDNVEGEFLINSDRTAPTITSIERASGIDDPTNESPFDIEIIFSEEISDFDESGLSVTNGSATSFSTTDDIEFTVTIEPDDVDDSSNTLEISVPEGVFTDLAGNDNVADDENFTIEFGDTRPTAELTSSENDPTNADDFEVTLDVTEIFGQQVSSIDSDDFTTTRAEITDIDDAGNPDFVLTVEPDEEGEISIQLDENVLTDLAGNQNEASNEFTITYDISPPTVAITSDEEDPTNSDDFEVTFTFSKPVFNFEINDIDAGNAGLSEFSGNDGDTEYTVTVAPDGDGLVSVDVPEGAARDAAGNDNEQADDAFEITSDRTAPTVITLEAADALDDPTNQSPLDVRIVFSEQLDSFDDSELSLTNAELDELTTSDNTEFIATVVPQSDGLVSLSVNAEFGQDEAGNQSEASDDAFEITFNGTPPEVVLTTDESDPTNADNFEIDITFSEPVFDFEMSDIEVSNAELSELSGSDGDTEFTVNAAPDDDGLITLQIPEDVARDEAENTNLVSDVLEVTSDRTPPVLTFDADTNDPTFANTFTLTVTFSEEVSTLELQDLQADNADLSEFETISPTEYAVEVSPEEDGLVSILIAEASATDEAGNGNEEAEFTITYDTSPPQVALLSPEDESEEISILPDFSWEEADRATTYELQVATETNFDDASKVKDITGIEDLSYTAQQELDWDNDHYFRVRGNNEGITGEWSEPFTFLTIPEPPPAVVLNNPEDAAIDIELQPELNWQVTDRAESYQLQLVAGSDFDDLLYDESGLDDTDFQVTEDLSEETEYSWRVRAVNTGGNGNWSDTATFTTIPMPPSKVELTAPIDSTGSIPVQPDFEWVESERASTYEFQVSSDVDFIEIVEDAVDLEENSFTASATLDHYAAYFWRVRAHNSGGTGEWSTTGTFVTEAQPPVTQFPDDNAEDISTAPTLVWSTVHSETRFEIELVDEDGEEIELESDHQNIDVSSLLPEQIYTWRVRLQDEITSSDWSNSSEFVTRGNPMPSEVDLSIAFGREGEDVDVSDYQLLGLPGDDGFGFDQLMPGDYKDDWRAFRDAGGDTDYYDEYDPEDNAFSFTPGKGYWVYSHDTVEFNSESTPIIPDDHDIFLISVNSGWNIISNPFYDPISWQEVLDFNDISGDLLGYDQAYHESDEMEPGVGYYFFNDPDWDLDELAIPYSPESNRVQVSDGNGEEQIAEQDSRISIMGSFINGNDDKLTTSTHIEYNNSSNNGRHPGMEMVRYGLAISGNEKSDGRADIFRRFQSSFNETGSEYYMTVKAPVGEQLIWKADMAGLSSEAAVLLANPVTNQSHLLMDADTAEVSVSEPEVTYSVFTGNQAYLEDIQDSLLPDEITLKQNYPNPFNADTNIRYALVEDSDVRLEIFDVLGRKVQVLVNDHQPKGWHVAQFNGSQHASGVYIYRLSDGNSIVTGKMMLVK